MSPEYRGEINKKSAALFTNKAGSGFWSGTLVERVDGAYHLGKDGDGVALGLHPTEQKVIEQAEGEHAFVAIDTWPPQNPNLTYYLGRLRSWLTFAKWKKG